MKAKRTVLVIDDHPLFRKALVTLMEDSLDCDVLPAASAEEGLLKVRNHRVDLILLDLGLPGAAGVDAVRMLRRGCDSPILAVSGSENRPEVAAAVRAGVIAVVSKNVSADTLLEVAASALAGTLDGPQWLRPAGTLQLAGEAQQLFSVRQQQIATLLLSGHSNKEIGIRLAVAEITVKSHLTAIFRILGVVNRTQAVVAIRRLGAEAEDDAVEMTV